MRGVIGPYTLCKDRRVRIAVTGGVGGPRS
jgi:hypothetical protein